MLIPKAKVDRRQDAVEQIFATIGYNGGFIAGVVAGTVAGTAKQVRKAVRRDPQKGWLLPPR
jgi:hypothetical protein